MTNSRVDDLNSDFVGLGRRNFDLLDTEGFASFPGDGGLTLDGLSCRRRQSALDLC